MAGDAGIDIGEAASAGNAPGDGTDSLAASDQRTAGVSHAVALAVLGEGANGAGEHHRTVVGGVAGLAVGVGQGARVQEHQVG